MSEEEIKNELDKVFWQQVKNNKKTKLWFEINYDNTQRLAKAIQGLLDLYEKEKENDKEMCKLYYDLGSNYCDLDEKCKRQQKEIDYLQTKTKRNENIEKIKMCMTHSMPNNTEIVCMVREDFERNFGNDYVSKDKIIDIIKDLEDFDTKFYISEELKLAIKNSLKELLGE